MSRADKQARIDFAKAYIIANPNKGKDAINKAVKAEFGVGLRRVYVASLKKSTLFGRPMRSTGIKSVEKLIEQQILLPGKTERQIETKLVTVGFDTAFHRMRSAGFADFEIRNIFSADGISLSFPSKPFIAMLKSRRAWVRDKKKRGWSNEDIITEIKKYYSVKDNKGNPIHSPFDFIKKEYEPRPKKDMTVVKKALDKDYEKRKQAKAADKVAGLYGRGNRKPRIIR